MRLIIYLVCFLLINISSFGYEIKGELINKDQSVSIIEGQTFNAHIRIWPFANADLIAVKEALNGKDFLDFFYIANVLKIEYSKNNEEVLEIEAKVILKKFYVPRTFYIWAYKSLTIPFDIRNIQPVKNPSKADFLIMQQPVKEYVESRSNYTVIVLVLAFILVASVVGFFLYKKAKEKKKKQIEFNRWNKMFKNANDRSSLEEIYKLKSQWLPLVGGETPPILMFFNMLNKIQFKKSWSEMEEHQVVESFDEMRSIFERH